MTISNWIKELSRLGSVEVIETLQVPNWSFPILSDSSFHWIPPPKSWFEIPLSMTARIAVMSDAWDSGGSRRSNLMVTALLAAFSVVWVHFS